MGRYVVLLSGASGIAYGTRLVDVLCGLGHDVALVVTPGGEQVLRHEAPSWQPPAAASRYGAEDLMAPIASGTYPVDGTVVCPASMGMVSAVACGSSRNLAERAADVALKEGRRLVMVPRESPLGTLHLENLLRLARLGVRVVPAMPAFYQQPASVADMVDFVVGKVLLAVDLPQHLFRPWGDQKPELKQESNVRYNEHKGPGNEGIGKEQP